MRDLKSIDLPALIRETVVTPQLAVHKIIGMKIPRQTLWLGLALLTILNTILYTISGLLYPPIDPSAQAFFNPIVDTPLMFAGFMFVILALVVKLLSSIGASMGGKAQFDDLLVLITWMQVLRLIVGLITLVFASIAPGLISLLALAAGAWGVYIHIVFIDEAHALHSRVKAGIMMVLVYAGATAGVIVALLAVVFLIKGVL